MLWIAQTPKGAAVVAIAVLAGRASISGDTAAAVPDVIVSLASGLCLRLPQTAYDATEDPSTYDGVIISCQHCLKACLTLTTVLKRRLRLLVQ